MVDVCDRAVGSVGHHVSVVIADVIVIEGFAGVGRSEMGRISSLTAMVTPVHAVPGLENAPRPCGGHDRTAILIGVLAGQRDVTADDLDVPVHQVRDFADALAAIRRAGESGPSRGARGTLLGFPSRWRFRLVRAMRRQPRVLRPRRSPPKRAGSAPPQSRPRPDSAEADA
jgi:hypothetical protein